MCEAKGGNSGAGEPDRNSTAVKRAGGRIEFSWRSCPGLGNRRSVVVAPAGALPTSRDNKFSAGNSDPAGQRLNDVELILSRKFGPRSRQASRAIAPAFLRVAADEPLSSASSWVEQTRSADSGDSLLDLP